MIIHFLYCMLNELLDAFEDDDNALPDQFDIIIHPPGDGDGCSDEEDRDEDQSRFQLKLTRDASERSCGNA